MAVIAHDLSHGLMIDNCISYNHFNGFVNDDSESL